MTLPLTFNGRLPGVVCQTALPPRGEAPLRLDVAAFVGFAERGPLHTPVPLEDANQFSAIFGADLPVAREAGRPVYAHLAGAVRAFFDNGGRRCYAVRVAGDAARPNRFPLPGLVTWDAGAASGEPVLRRPVVPAAWPGSWSDGMTVGTQLRRWPLRPHDFRAGAGLGELDLELPPDVSLAPGDVLRLQADGTRNPLVFFPVSSVRKLAHPLRAGGGRPVTAVAEHVLAFAALLDPPPAPASADRLGEAGWETLVPYVMSGLDPLPFGRYRLRLPASVPVQPGDLLRLGCTDGSAVLFPVASVTTVWPQADGSPPDGPELELIGRAPLVEWPGFDPGALGTVRQADLLGFDLTLTEGNEPAESWPELRFGAGSNAWGDRLVPQDRDALEQVFGDLGVSRSTRLAAPVATAADVFYLPLGMAELPGPDQFARRLPDDSLAAAGDKDGLAVFDPVNLFLDARLKSSGARTLLDEADRLLYLHDPPAHLCGLHSLIAVDEIGLVALPDVVHRPWRPAIPAFSTPPPPPTPEPPPVDWSQFRDCPVPPPAPPPPPRPLCKLPPEYGSPPYGLSQDEEDLSPQARLELLPELDPPAAYGAGPLLEVQQALVNFCAARADVLGILSLPGHFKQQETLDWQQQLTGTLAFLDGNVLSYVAAYHPWLVGREETAPQFTPLRAEPPDGAVCGMIAAREIARGPWIAPANVPLVNVMGLEPVFSAADQVALFNAQVNAVRQQPGVFVTTAAHTLGLDRSLVQVSVRRLLIFLRKLALRRGMQYVFETNNERFQQQVQGSFERALNLLMARGGLAAFEVSTTDGLNTQNDVDNGRFLIALKVAPTLPVEFITVILLRSGEGLLQVLER